MLSYNKIRGDKKLFDIVFYHTKNNECEILDYLNELAEKGKTDKNARVNHTKILAYLSALAQYGTRVGQPFVKHIEGSIWELRPLANRIFFFYWKDNKFVLLHHFIKKSQKTPQKEIEKARQNLKDFIERSEKL
jgi:phage-related protein